MKYKFAVYDKRPRAIYTQTGAFISMISCSIIVLSYLRKRKWRQHPNPLLFWKSVVDLAFAVRFQYDWDQYVNQYGCRILATTTQFCSFASECWFLSMSLNLYQCSTNPFTNVKQNMQWYHLFSWGIGLFFSAMLWFSEVEFNPRNDPACFVDESDTTFLLMYYVVVVLSVLCAVVFSILESRSHTFGGMKEALEAKKDVIRSARIFTFAYIIYQIILISLWISDIAFLEEREPLVQAVRNITSFLQTSKGFIDLVIWLCINKWSVSDCVGRENASLSLEASEGFSDIDIDLQPQLNAALRKEVLHFTTRGVVAASSNVPKVTDARRVVRLRLHEMGMTVRFNDYNPTSFRDIRRGFGIKEVLYRKSFLATCHERIQSGGSSGAFMFYTADYSFLVKSVTKSERAVLLRMLPAYIKYMKTHPGSHLTRFYGCHSIEMYGQDFSFVVMGNAIGRVSMHQFYDIKGSWIDRNAEAIPPGKTVICTYCSNAFKYGSTESCQYSIHGTHLPHVVLKDNDFHRKLRVLPDTADELISQLAADSDFLCAQGIMDYSLLLSVHSTKYVVDHTSFDANSLIKSPTKRKVNYPVCYPDADDPYASTLFNELLENTAETSSDEDLADIETGNRQKFARSCRYSVLNFHDESNRKLQINAPLLGSNGTFNRYDSVSFTPSLDLGSPHVDQTKWIGKRSLEKPGYQAYVVVGPDYYTLGVVDMLQTWTWCKRLERLWKTWVLRCDGNGISAAPPKLYSDRFKRKMREIMLVSSSQIGFGHQ
uniref:PIPK domain-containing protein n=1 Tax=Globisporangium ultimum (strain ATCC 200006 / CBS 805.95 / DAOM BR144) TaxID=431595 RepID=K3WK58_GLOUD